MLQIVAEQGPISPSLDVKYSGVSVNKYVAALCDLYPSVKAVSRLGYNHYIIVVRVSDLLCFTRIIFI